MVKAPLVSVIMSVYNTHPDYLRASIDSILNQSFSDFEFIIIDDCADNSTKEVLYSYTYDSRVKLFENACNKGLTHNLNTCLSVAKGKYIARMDADDIADTKRFEEQVIFLEAHEEIAVVGTYYYVLVDGKTNKSKKVAISPDNNKARWFFTNDGIMHASVMMRSSIVNCNAGYSYDTHFSRTQDYDLWVRLSRDYKITVLPNYLMAYRVSDDQVSKQYSKQQLMYFDEIVMRQFSVLLPNATEIQISIHLNVCKGIINHDSKELFNLCKTIKHNNHKLKCYSISSFNYYANYFYCRNCVKSIHCIKDLAYSFRLLFKLILSWAIYFPLEAIYKTRTFKSYCF